MSRWRRWTLSAIRCRESLWGGCDVTRVPRTSTRTSPHRKPCTHQVQSAECRRSRLRPRTKSCLKLRHRCTKRRDVLSQLIWTLNIRCRAVELSIEPIETNILKKHCPQLNASKLPKLHSSRTNSCASPDFDTFRRTSKVSSPEFESCRRCRLRLGRVVENPRNLSQRWRKSR